MYIYAQLITKSYLSPSVSPPTPPTDTAPCVLQSPSLLRAYISPHMTNRMTLVDRSIASSPGMESSTDLVRFESGTVDFTDTREHEGWGVVTPPPPLQAPYPTNR